MEERIKNIIDKMQKTNQYDTSLERIINYIEQYPNSTRQDVIIFVNGEIDYTEHNCEDKDLKEYICDTFRTFLCRF